MASGFETLQDVERAIAELRADERGLSRELEADNVARTQLMRERSAAIRELAETRIHSALRDGVIDEADRLETDVEMILKARAEGMRDLEGRTSETQSRHAQKLKDAETVHARLQDLEADLDRFGDQARAKLGANLNYKNAVARRHTLDAQIERAAAKAEQAEADREAKGAPYRDDPLFMYLWQRDYRGRNYASTGLIRWLDGKVAGFIGWHQARANFAMLNEIPERLRGHVVRLGEERETVTAKLAELEAETTVAMVPDGFLAQLEDARKEQMDIDGALSALEATLTQLDDEANAYAEGRDGQFDMAIATLTDFIDQERYNRLQREARRTATSKDDAIVSRIGGLNRKLKDLSEAQGRQRSKLNKIAKRRRELTEIAQDFRRRSLHRPGSVFDFDFDDDDVEDLLKNVVRGGLTALEWWIWAQGRQTWSGRSGDSYRRSRGMPPFNWGGSRGRRSSNRSRGGFRTGGGF